MSKENIKVMTPKGPGMRFSTDRAKDFKKTFKNLMKYLKKYKNLMILVALIAISSTIFSILGPKILGNAITEIFNGLVNKISNNGGMNFDKIGLILLLLLGLYILSSILTFLQNFIMSGISQKVSYDLRKKISIKMNKLPMRYFDTKTHGEILSRVTNDVDIVSQNLNQSITQVITSITTIIGVLIMMLTISPLMTLVSLTLLPLSLTCVSFIVKKSQKYFRLQQEYLGHINGEIEESYGGHNIIKAFNKEEETINKFDELNNTLYESGWKSQFISGIMMPIMRFIGNIGYVVAVILGGWLTIKNKIEVGSIVSFTQYIRNFTQPLSQVAQIANLMQATMAASERVFEFLDEEEEKEFVKNPVSIDNIKGSVTFKNVSFGYNENRTIINDFSVKVKNGEKIAIVGPTGAGKTTIVKLLMRFYDINSGQILIDNHDIRDFNRHELRKLFGMVLQDTWLFSGTIKDNLRYGNLDATDEDIKNACKLTHIDHFIKTLPNGYDMQLNEEASNISLGQKQLLTIARVILADPKILILDEATSSVDTRTEVLIQQAMDKLMEGRTSFIIAHRLSTIRNADLILVMNEGDIVEIGNHDDLLKKNGFYSKLYNSQFEESEI